MCARAAVLKSRRILRTYAEHRFRYPIMRMITPDTQDPRTILTLHCETTVNKLSVGR